MSQARGRRKGLEFKLEVAPETVGRKKAKGCVECHSPRLPWSFKGDCGGGKKEKKEADIEREGR